MSSKSSEIERFLQVVSELRKKCPWDKKQTHQSLRPYLVEEAYELLEALDDEQYPVMKEELGDLLLQICLHAEIASEGGNFDFQDVAKAVADKMIARHPHVYGDVEVADENEVKRNWMELKKKEKPDRALLDGIPTALPSLLLAHKYGHRAASVGFDWPDLEGVLKKIVEEAEELKKAASSGSPSAMSEEFGDLLFSMVQLGRKLKLDSEGALRDACQKFAKRIGHMEEHAQKEKKKLSDYDADALESLWQAAKQS